MRKALQNWVVACTGLPPTKVVWARQMDAAKPLRDGIIMMIYVVDDEGYSWVDIEDKYLTFANKTITAVSGNNLTIPAHDLRTGDGPVHLVGGDLPAPLEIGVSYWVIVVDANTIQLAAQFEDTGGDPDLVHGNPIVPITLTDAGSGLMTLTDVDEKTLRAGEEIQHVQRGMVRMTLQLFSYVNDDTGEDGAIAILRRVASRYKLPTNRAILDNAKIAVTSMERTRSMLGSRDAVLFEPRAWLDIAMSFVEEQREDGTIIGRVEVSQESPDPTWTELVEGEDL